METRPTVLIVDAPSEAEESAAVLAAAGVRVRVAIDALTGAFELGAIRPDLLVAGLTLPGNAGPALARLARSRGIRVLLTGGDPGAPARLGLPVLTNPVRPASLLAAVRAAVPDVPAAPNRLRPCEARVTAPLSLPTLPRLTDRLVLAQSQLPG